MGCRLRQLRPRAEGHCRARAYVRAAVIRDLAVAVELSFGHGITRWHARRDVRITDLQYRRDRSRREIAEVVLASPPADHTFLLPRCAARYSFAACVA